MDQKWLRHIISQHHEASFRWACHCSQGNTELAKDVLQMAYLKILEGKARFNQRSQAKTWLFSVIRFTALDELKKQSKHEHVDLEVLQNTSEESFNETDRYFQLLQRLSEKQKEVLLLVFYHNLTIESASEVMECNLGTARTHYQRGKNRLKEMIENEKVK